MIESCTRAAVAVLLSLIMVMRIVKRTSIAYSCIKTGAGASTRGIVIAVVVAVVVVVVIVVGVINLTIPV
jgi:hypothetical protein